MDIPDDADFIEVLGAAPEPMEHDPDIWRIDVPIGDAQFVTLTFDIGARSVRLTKGSETKSEIEIYREQVDRILLYTGNDERGIIVESHVPGFRCELRAVISPEFRLTDPMLYVG
ncbi:hypothetical protein [Streptomyces subrutilus]|uniref:Uncharacterized protein n=1 Tax=Streptomyces subrutilus TaxID=36818 RepID=A0A1E5PTZ0_9ACTN|nr:hypothetical protein [Streptomyces subrutilus]OEJ32950.1 hypothetical protein BGK67_17920 [Streptomyces subrutilus]